MLKNPEVFFASPVNWHYQKGKYYLQGICFLTKWLTSIQKEIATPKYNRCLWSSLKCIVCVLFIHRGDYQINGLNASSKHCELFWWQATRDRIRTTASLGLAHGSAIVARAGLQVISLQGGVNSDCRFELFLFDLFSGTVVIVIIHNGLPQRTLLLCLTVKLTCLCLEPCPPVDCRKEEIDTSSCLRLAIIGHICKINGLSTLFPEHPPPTQSLIYI